MSLKIFAKQNAILLNKILKIMQDTLSWKYLIKAFQIGYNLIFTRIKSVNREACNWLFSKENNFFSRGFSKLDKKQTAEIAKQMFVWRVKRATEKRL